MVLSDVSEVYALFEATGVEPGSKAMLTSPKLPLATQRCLVFHYLARGRHFGSLQITDEQDNSLWSLHHSDIDTELGGYPNNLSIMIQYVKLNYTYTAHEQLLYIHDYMCHRAEPSGALANGSSDVSRRFDALCGGG